MAVVVVISDHLFDWPAGGFIGVDVFFVISGFLITGLLLREHEKTGRISWVDFYRRRVKRIMPASTVVLVVTIAAAYLLYRATRFQTVVDDGIWAFLFASNWRFAAIGTDYLQASGPVSPLQHFWSLAVEEQFYIVWPVLLILTLGVVGRQFRIRGRSPMPLVVGSMAVLGLASFIWALHETADDPTVAYFSTFSRGWELAVGAILAATSAQLTRIPIRLRPVLSYLGLAGIAAGLFLVTAASAFPAPWAALPVFSAALVIAAGVGGAPRFAWLLTNPVSVYIGKISYSLYLWHFPVVILLAAVVPETSPGYYVVALVTMVTLAVLSFRLVEDPARRSSWLESRQTRKSTAHNGRRSHPERRFDPRVLVACVIAVDVIVVTLAVTKTSAARADVPLASPAPIPSSPADVRTTTAAQTQLAQQIGAALAVAEWPDLSPSLDTISWRSKASEWVNDGCLDSEVNALPDPAANAARCVYGDPAATKTAVLLGDSFGISYVPAIRSALEPQGYKIEVIAMQQCPVAAVEVTKGEGAPHPDCAPFQAWAAQQVATIHPDLLVLSNASNSLARMVGVEGAQVASTWRAGMKTALDRLAGSADRTVLLAPAPVGKDLVECATQLSKPSACVGDISDIYRTQSVIEKDVAANRDGVTYVETSGWFCSDTGRCPAFVGTTPMTADGGHLTDAYSRTMLTAVMTEALLG